MEMSRLLRVGTRNYIIRIAAVSQDHVLVCITRKVTRPENNMDLVLHRNWPGSRVSGRNRHRFSVGGRI